jgi:hypothetical protein
MYFRREQSATFNEKNATQKTRLCFLIEARSARAGYLCGIVVAATLQLILCLMFWGQLKENVTCRLHRIIP